MAYNPYAVPQQPAPKNNTLRVVLITVGAVAVLCLGVIGVSLYIGINSVKDNVKEIGPAQLAATRFVASLEQGDTDGAYGQLCDSTRSAFTKAAFADVVAKQPKITAHADPLVNITTTNGRTVATAVMTLTLGDGSTQRHGFTLVKESDTWKVCGRPY
ncbi:hypothetical protein [Dactylosporangium sp. NPDC051541]|uniref:Rv0361 family membrane protein n=1 Tax=Dactylosporangium sp. NPDC051541 TaxID=3363977 RepID=UPI0037B50140